jgi:hypothetical protein
MTTFPRSFVNDLGSELIQKGLEKSGVFSLTRADVNGGKERRPIMSIVGKTPTINPKFF